MAPAVGRPEDTRINGGSTSEMHQNWPWDTFHRHKVLLNIMGDSTPAPEGLLPLTDRLEESDQPSKQKVSDIKQGDLVKAFRGMKDCRRSAWKRGSTWAFTWEL